MPYAAHWEPRLQETPSGALQTSHRCFMPCAFLRVFPAYRFMPRACSRAACGRSEYMVSFKYGYTETAET